MSDARTEHGEKHKLNKKKKRATDTGSNLFERTGRVKGWRKGYKHQEDGIVRFGVT